MSPEKTIALIGAGIIAITLLVIVVRKLPKRLKSSHYTRKWRDIQGMCGRKETWPEAIIGADKLLDEVLKKRRKSGKTMGERLVNVQDVLSNNDAVWNAHKLANHLDGHDGNQKLKDTDVKNALIAFRQALRDLGAL